MNSGEEIKWYYQPLVVIALLFLVLGPFGLPFLYKSPRFNKFWKMILTILTAVYTGYLVIITIGTVREIFKSYPELKMLLG